jgi:hypothetical protein
MGDVIAPGGWLYVGHSERVQGSADLFALETTTTYKRLDEAAR